MRVIWLALLLAGGHLLIDYRLNNNSDGKVIDLSGNNNHGQIPARGTASAVITPYGLYLDGELIKLPPNGYTESSLIFYPPFSMSCLVRLLSEASSSVPREIISFKLGSSTRLQLRQISQEESGSLYLELVYVLDGLPYTSTLIPFEPSKANLENWFYFVISVVDYNEYADYHTSVTLSVNGVSMFSDIRNGDISGNFDDNSLNGPTTKAIYYSFRYSDEEALCSGYVGDFSLTDAQGLSCAYACTGDKQRLCSSDTFTSDFECDVCPSTCGNYGCMQDSPLACWSADCPPASVTSSSCRQCYANAKSSDGKCVCEAKFVQVSEHPLTCVGKS
jgi:hypothetical protein